MLDIHCHILPGVDDGSRDLKESVQMLQAAKAVGITHIVATPHMRWSDFSVEAILDAYEQLLPHAQKLGITLVQAYEVNWKKLAEVGIDTARQWAIPNTNLFLLEFNDEALPANWKQLIVHLSNQGLKVIIAHPERYAAIQRKPELAHELKQLGCYLQLSANFIEDGRFGPRRKLAKYLLDQGLADYVASDAHRPSHYDMFKKALEFAR